MWLEERQLITGTARQSFKCLLSFHVSEKYDLWETQAIKRNERMRWRGNVHAHI